jgi:glycosyltransferase involved in cell wall biosynthesis
MHIPEEKIVIKPNFFSPSLPPIRILPRRRDYLYVGRLSPEKGIDMLLSAFVNSNYSLRIIGEGPLRKKVEQVAAKHANVHYLGYQHKTKIIEELRRCSALVFATIGFEQFGMVIIEAFACGAAVISPDTGSPAELVHNGVNGLHFRTGSPDDLLRKIEEWESSSEETRQAYSENALRTHQQYFTPEINLDQLSNIYKSVLYEKNASA